MKKDSELFSQRLAQSMKDEGYQVRPVVLEREFNQRYWGRSVSVQAIRKWLVGEVIPTQDKLQVLAEWLKVDPHWLRFGERLSGSIQQQRKRWDEDLSFEERKVIEKFIQLPADKRRIIGDIIETYYSTLED